MNINKKIISSIVKLNPTIIKRIVPFEQIGIERQLNVLNPYNSSLAKEITPISITAEKII